MGTNVNSGLSFEELCKQMDALEKAGEFPQIKEVLIVDKDGEKIRRYKRSQ